jgi:hypothetical protein
MCDLVWPSEKVKTKTKITRRAGPIVSTMSDIAYFCQIFYEEFDFPQAWFYFGKV